MTGEALASGVPVVLSDEVGPSEVAAGPHARVYPAGDVDAFEAAVRDLLDAVRADRAGLAASARANAEREFAPSQVMSQLIDIIAAVGDGAVDGEPRAARRGADALGPLGDELERSPAVN